MLGHSAVHAEEDNRDNHTDGKGDAGGRPIVLKDRKWLADKKYGEHLYKKCDQNKGSARNEIRFL